MFKKNKPIEIKSVRYKLDLEYQFIVGRAYNTIERIFWFATFMEAKNFKKSIAECGEASNEIQSFKLNLNLRYVFQDLWITKVVTINNKDIEEPIHED